MKKIVMTLLLILMIATSCYAENFLEYKRVILCVIHRTVLVNRITGEVKYMRLVPTRKWALLTGLLKTQYQSMYNAQVSLKTVCH